MDLTVFTWPEALKGEIDFIKALIDRGLKTVHLRRPYWSPHQTAKFLDSLSLEESKTIILHQHPDLRQEFPVKGIHFSSRLPLKGREEMLQEKDLIFSTSVHQLDQIKDLHYNLNMAYISPIFDSISKKEHFANFECSLLGELLEKNYNIMPLVYALGGVSAKTIPIAKRLGFSGVGVLGTLWEHYRTEGFMPAVDKFNSLVKACKA